MHCPSCGAELNPPTPHFCRSLAPLAQLIEEDEASDQRYAEAISEWDDLDPQEQAISREQIIYLKRLAKAFSLLEDDERQFWLERFEQLAADHDTAEGVR